jgi:hypothetical protein
MAVASYTTDLTAIIENITATTGWSALGGGASGLGVGADYAMQGSNAVDKQVTAAEKGMMYNGSATLGANDHIFTWLYLATAGLSDTLALRGLTVAIGSSTTAYMKFHVEGNDTYGAVGRVGRCYPVRYHTTANTGSIPYSTKVGTPTATPVYFGALTNQTGTVKGANLGISAIRYGTGIYITAGDVGSPATFSGTAAIDNAIANRWGVLTLIAGSSYELQGRYVIGQSSAGTPTLAYFADSNKNITLVDTPHSQTDFTQIIIDHASTIVNLTNITIEAVGTNNKGKLVYNNASTVSALDGCSFVKFGTSTLQAGVTAVGCAWRQSDVVTLNSAVITSSVFSNTTAASAVVTSALSNLVTCDFVSDGSSHAVELTSIGGGSMTWDGTATSYVAGVTGSPVTPTSTGNEALFVNVGSGTLTVNVATGATVPSIRSAGATINVVAGLATLTLTGLLTGSDIIINTTGTNTPLVDIDQNAGSSYGYSFTFSPGTYVDIKIMKAGYLPYQVYNLLLTSSATAELPIAQSVDRTYV